MSLTEGDKAICRDVAREIIKDVMRFHVDACPHGAKIRNFKFTLIGICIGSSAVGGTSVLGLLKLFDGL